MVDAFEMVRSNSKYKKDLRQVVTRRSSSLRRIACHIFGSESFCSLEAAASAVSASWSVAGGFQAKAKKPWLLLHM